VTKPAEIDPAVRRAQALGPVDVVFNNAGYGLVGPLEGATDEQLAAEMEGLANPGTPYANRAEAELGK
jgi:NAD(P)-dependent dehydrogenase (short-subunit alcohol dehydrogenase family)